MSKFPLGQLMATPGVLRAVEASGDDLPGFISRHAAGDWGDVSAGDKRAKDRDVIDGNRLLSAYHLEDGTKVWVLTEGDRSATTVLLPEEY